MIEYSPKRFTDVRRQDLAIKLNDERRGIRSRVRRFGAPIILATSIAGFVGDFSYSDLSAQTKSEAESTLLEPDNPKLQRMYENLFRADANNNYERVGKIIDRIDAFQIESAAEHGLTLHDPEPYQERIDQASEVSEITAVIDEYTKKFGMSFEIPERWDARDLLVEFNPVDQGTVDLPAYKFGARYFMGVLSRLPEEVVRLSGFKKIQLVRDMDLTLMQSDSNKAGAANIYNNVMYLDFDGFNSYSLGVYTRHELSHGIDATICGDSGHLRDSEYESLNPEGFSYGVPREDLLTVVSTEYAGKNSREDKAELMGDMLAGLNDYETFSPVLRAKYSLLLARLEANIPGISDYLRSIGLSNSMEIAEISS